MDLRDSLGLPIESKDNAITYSESEVITKSIHFLTIEDYQQNLGINLNQYEKDSHIYSVHEGIRKVQDKEIWSDIRFSIMVLNSGHLNEQYFNTIGYYRTIADNGHGYPEVLQLADGYIECLLQQPREQHEQVKDVVVVRMQKQDILIVPPAYSLTIINPSDKRAIISRIRASDVEEIYMPFHTTKGSCYYRLLDGRWDYNPNYEEIPNLRLSEPQNKWKNLKRGIPIYGSYTYNPNYFRSLVNPEPSLFSI